jgi:hypothetical protein
VGIESLIVQNKNIKTQALVGNKKAPAIAAGACPEKSEKG